MNITQHNLQYAYWSAVFALFMGVTNLISAEFIPISLLTDIANDLHITEGQTGQAVTAVGVFAVITSLLIAPLTKNINKKTILLVFSILLIFSNLLVAAAPNYIILLIGRCILGVCVGGFWSLTSAVALQLVPQQDVPRALSIIYTGVSAATIISLPFASYLGYLLGWRTIFYLTALLGVINFIWQFISLPSLPTFKESSFKEMSNLIKQSWVFTGLMATICSFAGYHIFFTYLKPFLKYNLHLEPYSLTLTLLFFGLANCLGTLISSFFLNKLFKTIMIVIHFILFIVAILFLFHQNNLTENIITIIVWGFIFGIIPVGWSTWITRTLADKAEMAGGLMVAAIQFSITLAAGLGGVLYDHYGITTIFLTSACIFLASILFICISFTLFRKNTGRVI